MRFEVRFSTANMEETRLLTAHGFVLELLQEKAEVMLHVSLATGGPSLSQTGLIFADQSSPLSRPKQGLCVEQLIAVDV